MFPFFLKIHEKIIYNCLYKYLTDNSILYKKQFGFQELHSTEHAIFQLVDQIRNSFESKQYTFGVIVDLSKVFDTVNHKYCNFQIRKLRTKREEPTLVYQLLNKSNTIHKT